MITPTPSPSTATASLKAADVTAVIAALNTVVQIPADAQTITIIIKPTGDGLLNVRNSK